MNKKLLTGLLLIGLVTGCNGETNSSSDSSTKDSSTTTSSQVSSSSSNSSSSFTNSTTTSISSSDFVSNSSSSSSSSSSSNSSSSSSSSTSSSSSISSSSSTSSSSSSSTSSSSSSSIQVEYNATVYYYNTNGWSTVNCYSWDASGTTLNGSWPGTVMTPVEDHENWYEATYVAGDTFNVIFNNSSAQTPDIAATSENKYFFGSSTTGYSSFEEAELAASTAPDTEITIYFSNSENWSTVYCYAWQGSVANGGWPGVEMTAVGNNIYSYTLDTALYGNIIFGDGSSQTVDLSLTGAVDGTLFQLDSYVDGKWTCTTSVYEG